MSWIRFFRRNQWDQERARELDAYLQIETDSNIAAGMAPDAARAAAHAKLGSATRVREEIYTMNSFGFLESLWHDIRYGLRLLRKGPGFTATAIATLALGIGANTAMFSVINAVVLQPLPYRDPSRLLIYWSDLHQEGFEKIGISVPEYADVRDNGRFFSGFGAYTGGGMTLTGHGDAESLVTIPVTHNLFSVLGVSALRGRTFAAEDATAGHNHVAVLSYSFWQSHFGGDPAIVGQNITLDQLPYTVIGVMPPTFAFPSPNTELWTPLLITPDMLDDNNRGSHYLRPVGRLAPGVTLAQAQGQAGALAQRMGHDHPQSYPAGYGAHLTSLQSETVGDASHALWILMAAVGVVLLIACANIANLLLARAGVRRREVALRGALGATRLRLVRQFLTEGALLAVGGGAAGLAIAAAGIPVLLRMGGSQVPRAQEVHINLPVVLFTIAVSLCAVVSFALVPALQGSLIHVQTAIREGGSGTAHSSRSRLRNTLVVAQMAAAMVLLVGAGLLVRSFLNVVRVDPGFASSRLLTFRVPIPSTRYPDFVRRTAFYSELLDRLSARPGVQSVAAISALPFSGYANDRGFQIEGRVRGANGQYPDEQFQYVSPGYFHTMGIPLLRGRDFSRHDNAENPSVVIVNQAFVDRYWPGESGLGRRIAYYAGVKGDHPQWREIIGVFGNVHHSGLESAQPAEAYIPMLQPLISVTESSIPSLFIAVRTSFAPPEFTAQARAELAKLDPATPLSNLRTMEERIEESQSTRRFQTLLLGTFAVMALLLAAIGIYGVTAYTVQQRRLEFGVRMALGAQAADILRLILFAGGRMVLTGLIIGIALAAALSRMIGTLLFHVAPVDPLSFAAGIVFLAAIALIGCWAPARRALRSDPLVALREE